MILPDIDRQGPLPLGRQLYLRLRDQILAGALHPGERLPSTRGLGRELGVSRNTVLEAYDQLHAEGYLTARTGSGTVVSGGAVFRQRAAPAVPALPPMGFGPFRTDIVDFRSGLPDLSRFPVRAWQRLSRDVWGQVGPRDLAYSQPEGRQELRCRQENGSQETREHQGAAADRSKTSEATSAFEAARALKGTAEPSAPRARRATS